MAGETIWRRFRRKAVQGARVVASRPPAKSSEAAPDTKEAEALVATLNHSAERVQTLWFSFLIFMVYLAIATGTTTHRMLFLASPLNLPVLNIPLPLLGFYILTPVIFVVFHFYMLLNLVLLARTAKSFEDAVTRAFPYDGESRENFRMRIENTLFVQLLVGGRLERDGINAKLLSLMALITLAVAPVALMLMIQIKFLPYHSEPITWLHRGLLAVDLVLVWTLWPGYRSGWGVRLWPKKSWWLVWPAILSTTALVYAVLVATFPDERMYLATNRLHGIAPVNTLDLHGEDLIDDAKLNRTPGKIDSAASESRWVASLSLAGRDLTGADLSDADVRYVDFSHAILNRAYLDRAWAENTHLDDAQLQGASLDNARLKSTSLDFAQLQGASLNFAQLQGASLESAKLQGTSLRATQLQGTSMKWVQLQGASLSSAQLQGAELYYTQLQGASLDHTQLQGAELYNAQLQGAELYYAQLQGALIENVCAWRADVRMAIWEDTRFVSLKTRAKDEFPDQFLDCNWTAASFEELQKLINEQVPEGENRRKAMERIEQTLDPNKPLEGEEEMTIVWADHERSSPAPEVYLKSHAEQWRKAGCAAEGAPYVLRRLLRGWDEPTSSPERPKLAAAFLAPDCAGARGLSEAEIAKLKTIRDSVPPPAPKP